jgi:MFS family permease
VAVGLLALVVALVIEPSRAALDGQDRMYRSGHSPWWQRVIGPVLLVWRHRRLRLFACASFTFTAMQLSLGTFWVSYLVHDISLTLVQAGLILAVSQGGGVLGRGLWGAIADHFVGACAMLLLLAVLMSACALATLTISPTWPFWALAMLSALFGATAIGWNGVFLAEVAHLAPTGRAGEATGGVLFFTYAGVVFGPSLFGLLVLPLGGYAQTFSILAVFTLLGGLLILLAGPRSKNNRPLA